MHAVDDKGLRECMDRACPCKQYDPPLSTPADEVTPAIEETAAHYAAGEHPETDT